MKKFIRIFTLATFAVFSLGARLEAAASPQDDYLQIYVMINEGDKLSTAGQSSQAREKYETALSRLEKLKNENPEWEPTIVKYRIKYLNDKMAALKTAKETAPPPTPSAAEKSMPAPTPPPPAAAITPAPAKTETPSSEPAPAPLPTPVATSDDPSALRQRIIQLTGDLESARTELKQAKADLDQALVDKKGLQERLSSAGSGDANVAALQQENSALRAKLATTEESLKKAAGGELGGELASLRTQVDSLEKKLAEANSKSAELARANEDYKKQIADLTGRLQLAGTAGKSDSTLAKENAMLRSILDRQLKEQARREAARRLVLDEFKNLAVSTEALKTQMEVLSSPLVALSAEEENMLKVSAPSLVAPEPEAPAAAGGTGASATLSSAAEKPVSPESYAEKPRIPEEFKDTAAKATSLYNEKKFDEAAAAYQEILNKYPQSIYALSNLGVVRFQQQKYPEAEKALREAIRVAPNDSFSHSVLGIVLVQQEKYDDAIQVLSRAVALDPNDAKTRNYLGISSSRKGLQEAAEQECRKAIELDDSYGDAHFNLAVIYATQTPPAKELAKRHYNRALELGVPKDEELEKLLN